MSCQLEWSRSSSETGPGRCFDNWRHGSAIAFDAMRYNHTANGTTRHENPMIPERLRIEVPAEISEVCQPVVSKSEERCFRFLHLLGSHNVGQCRAHRIGGVTQHPGNWPILHATDREDQRELRRRLNS